MKCKQCGFENSAGQSYCASCGAVLTNVRKSTAWFTVLIDIVLLLIFLPVGLCGALFTYAGLSESDPNNRSYAHAFLVFSVPCLLGGGTVVFLVIRGMLRRDPQ